MGMTMDWSKIGCIQEPPVQVRKAEPLARHTSFRIGGPADYMAFPASQAQLAFLLRTAWQEKQTAAILGAGTNVLAADAGKRGLTICTRASACWMRRRWRSNAASPWPGLLLLPGTTG